MRVSSNRSKDREQLLLGLGAASSGLRLDPLKRPALLAELEEGDDQVVLGGEVTIKRRLCDAGTVDHLVDADTADAAVREQYVGGFKDALTSSELLAAHGFNRSRHRTQHTPLTDRSVCSRKTVLYRYVETE
jgi:hypothetical protein